MKMMSNHTNRFISFIVFLLFSSCIAQNSEISISYYKQKDGKFKIEGGTIGVLKNGVWLSYDEEGNLTVAENYVNGELNGEFYTFWNDSIIFQHGYHKNNFREGPFEQYSDFGIIQRKGQFEKGKKTGRWEEYTSEGNLNRILEYGKNEKMKIILDNKLELSTPEYKKKEDNQE